MATKVTPEIEKMFKEFRSLCGAPIRAIQVTDDQLCDILDFVKGAYAEKVQNWLIEQNWAGLYGKNVSNLDFAYALSVRSLAFSSGSSPRLYLSLILRISPSGCLRSSDSDRMKFSVVDSVLSLLA